VLQNKQNTPNTPNTSNTPGEPGLRKGRGRWKLFAVIAVCAAPVIMSYLTFYVIKPEGRTNYGTLLDPRAYPIPQLAAQDLDGKALELDAYRGKWLMVQIDDAVCAAECQKKLYNMRQLRTAQGKQRGRIERVWLITDQAPVAPQLLKDYEGTRFLRVRPEVLKSWLPLEADTIPSDHIYLIDPLGNLMMRYQKNADPNKMKRDISKLLYVSGIG
jgi:cytochrome oxidase Cu insertion factor (SCO1/SenC/PrrC family)